MTENEIATIIVDSALEIHRKTGPGMLERVYRDCMVHVLIKRGLRVEKEKSISFQFEDLSFDNAFRLDILVEDKVIVEVKSTINLIDVHVSQLITYLKVTNKRLGLVINFNTPLIKDGIRRVANKLPPF